MLKKIKSKCLLLTVFAIALILGCNSSKKQFSKKNKTQTEPQKNVLFIMVDDLRPEFGAYGASHIHSPNMDNLATESALFEKAYVSSPVCGASRASLLMGMRPTRTRFNLLCHASEDAPEAISLPKRLKHNGYETISYGKIYHHAKDDEQAWTERWQPKPKKPSGGYDYLESQNVLRYAELIDNKKTKQKPWTGVPYESADVADTMYVDGQIAKKGIEKLNELAKSKKPFFMGIGFKKPHLPFNAPKKYWDLYNRSNIQLPENYARPSSIPSEAYHKFGELRSYYSVPQKGEVEEELAKTLIHGYYACVSYVDAQIGKLLKELNRLGLEENTIVVLLGDHGWNLGDHQLWCKHCNFRSSLVTPLIIKTPGMAPTKVEQVVEFIDIYPTVLDLLGLPTFEQLDGKTLRPLLIGKSREKNFAISRYQKGMSIATGNLLYTEYLNNNLGVDARMLFNHSTDPLELDNLSEKPEYGKLVDSLHTVLRSNWGKDF